MSSYFTEEIWMASKRIKRCSILLVILKMEIKTTTGHHCTPTILNAIRPYWMLLRVWRLEAHALIIGFQSNCVGLEDGTALELHGQEPGVWKESGFMVESWDRGLGFPCLPDGEKSLGYSTGLWSGWMRQGLWSRSCWARTG